MKRISLFFILFFYLIAEAQAQFITVNDVNLVSYLQSKVPSAMSGNQMDTTNTAVTTFRTINVTGYNILDLSGIKYFSSLDSLICGTGNMTSLAVLPNSLTYLNCQGNKITALPTLPGSLKELNCSYNKLTGAQVALPNTLVSFSCSQNFLSCIPPLPASLVSLYCDGNFITGLPILPDSLKNLNCAHNSITCFTTFPANITVNTFDSASGSWVISFGIFDNPYTCLPNFINATPVNDPGNINYLSRPPVCKGSDPNNCAVACVAVGIETNQVKNTVAIYPNPANDHVVIDFPAETGTLKILNSLGETFFKVKSKNAKQQVDISALTAGIYFIEIQTRGGVYTGKFIKE